MAFSSDAGHHFAALVAIVSQLRSPDGCPWDQEQTHYSLRPNLLEESYEVLTALDQGNPKALAEELGDLLLQVIMHCQIAEENGEFDVNDIIEVLQEKLVRRHPHVFGEVKVENSKEVEENWEIIKQQENKAASSLDGVPREMPALGRCQAISRRAARIGFEFPNEKEVKSKLEEELQELSKAKTPLEMEHEFGDVLFTLVNLGRWWGLDAESALRTANDRFGKRFNYMQKECARIGRPLSQLSGDAKEALWQQAKQDEGREHA
ncbi:nucleoside triphosphate pyrophosphohydrolase [SAR202 cluster bacterium AD-802-E10_MRT_200m]|nr:nucleoside triphosphate pyrophosphohydrolase [SAR202 cluster bacterium AD-802-E10_MRT_200m]